MNKVKVFARASRSRLRIDAHRAEMNRELGRAYIRPSEFNR